MVVRYQSCFNLSEICRKIWVWHPKQQHFPCHMSFRCIWISNQVGRMFKADLDGRR